MCMIKTLIVYKDNKKTYIISHDFFTFFILLFPYCIGYVAVLAWQAAEAAAKSPTQAS